MFEHQGVWLPDRERHFPSWMDQNGEIVDGRGTYQFKKWQACLPHIKNWRVAVDVGAHVGLWSMHMAKRFNHVLAFEPVMEYRQCWSRNMGAANTYMCDVESGESLPEILSYSDKGSVLLGVALGSVAGKVRMKIPELDGGLDTGGTHVDPVAEDGNVEIRTLDSFALDNVDFIKIDCEGYEHHVIEGARETLLRSNPCVIVEQKAHKLSSNFGIKGTPAVALLESMGAKVRKVISGDYILSW